MLVLSRKSGERIVICVGDDKIIIATIYVHGGQIKIGVEAPRDVTIYREELYQRICDQGQKKRNLASVATKVKTN